MCNRNPGAMDTPGHVCINFSNTKRILMVELGHTCFVTGVRSSITSSIEIHDSKRSNFESANCTRSWYSKMAQMYK